MDVSPVCANIGQFLSMFLRFASSQFRCIWTTSPEFSVSIMECSGCSSHGIHELHQNHSWFRRQTRLKRHRPPSPSYKRKLHEKENCLDKITNISLPSNCIVHSLPVRFHHPPCNVLDNIIELGIVAEVTHPHVQRTSKTFRALHPHRNMSFQSLL